MRRWIAVATVSLLTIGIFVYLSTRIGFVELHSFDCGQPVIVSTVDIPAGTSLNPLIAAGDFRTVCVTNELAVSDVVFNMRELQNQTTTATIYANEQIPLARLDIGLGGA